MAKTQSDGDENVENLWSLVYMLSMESADSSYVGPQEEIMF
jgi:hypothetical protein